MMMVLSLPVRYSLGSVEFFDSAEDKLRFRLMHFIVLPAFFEPFAHEGDVVLRLDDEQVDDERL
jgi:hypothetical protein